MLAPQIVRIFFNDRVDGAPPLSTAQIPMWNSFVRAVNNANELGATINITWQSGPMATSQQRGRAMRRFADVLELVGAPNVRWVTIQNEPNTAPKPGKVKQVTPERLGEMYHLLDGLLRQKGLRRQIRFMGGDLLEGLPNKPTNPLYQAHWLEHMSTHPHRILDAYSVHIYWRYDETPKIERRLSDVRAIVDGLANPKPLYVTEYGVRGRMGNGAIKPGNFQAGQLSIPITQTKIAAFQQAWFVIRAAQLRYAGVIKWDGYFGRYDAMKQACYSIGPPGPKGWPLYPSYYLHRLITMATAGGWSVVGIDSPSQSKQHVAAFAGNRDLTLLGLDEDGAQVNGKTSARRTYAFSNLPAGKRLSLALWNKNGGGKLVFEEPVTVSARGKAAIEVPLHSVFALSTKTLDS